MKAKLLKGLVVLVAGFSLLLGLRICYGYLSHPVADTQAAWNNGGRQGFAFNPGNYASSKITRGGKKAGGGSVTVDQKYERVADTSIASNQYEQDEKLLRALIKKHAAVVQYEQKSGLTGHRRLHLGIGVDPAKFDEMVEQVRAIGKLQSIRINKVDKTNDYRQLQAKRRSLVKARDGLVSLKDKGGQITELVTLQSKILETEQQIQQLGVQLGDFDAENEFCTVKVALNERRITTAEIPFVHRLKVAFEWTVRYYAGLLVIFFFGSLFLLVTLVVIDKLQAMHKLVSLMTDPAEPTEGESDDLEESAEQPDSA